MTKLHFDAYAIGQNNPHNKINKIKPIFVKHTQLLAKINTQNIRGGGEFLFQNPPFFFSPLNISESAQCDCLL
jgi:hypothetical protein